LGIVRCDIRRAAGSASRRRGRLHTIELGVIMSTFRDNQSNINQIDQVDDLPMKNLLTYPAQPSLDRRSMTHV
jgi:hypothetical protein